MMYPVLKGYSSLIAIIMVQSAKINVIPFNIYMYIYIFEIVEIANLV